MAYSYYKNLLANMQYEVHSNAEIDNILDEIAFDENITADEFQDLYLMIARIIRA